MTKYGLWSFQAAVLFYLLSFAAVSVRRSRAGGCFLAAGAAANLVSIACRYLACWPFLPLYQGPFFVPFVMGALSLRLFAKGGGAAVPRGFSILLVALLTLFFPKDYYLPFIQTRTVFAHFFFIFGVIAKACFFIAAAEAFHTLRQRWRSEESGAGRCDSVAGWIIWGFALLTASVFCGELWAYLGWGSPVVWEDSAIATTMATWCYYACFLHLHLSKQWNMARRLLFAGSGAILLLLFTACTELGNFQWPHC